VDIVRESAPVVASSMEILMKLAKLQESRGYSSVLDFGVCEWVELALNDLALCEVELNKTFRQYVEIVMGFAVDTDVNHDAMILNESFDHRKTSNPLKILAEVKKRTPLNDGHWSALKDSDTLQEEFKNRMGNRREFFIFGIRNKIIEWNPSYIKDCPLILTRTIYFILKNQFWLELEEDPDIHQKLLKLKASDIHTLAMLIKDYINIGGIHKILATVGCKILPTKPPVTLEWLGACKRALESEFNDDSDLLNRFSKFLESCFLKQSANPNMYVGPYTTIIQSSGNGKTRLCLEYGQTCEPIIYMSLGQSTAECYPPGNETFVNLFKAAVSEESMLNVLYYIFTRIFVILFRL
jgi:hypothetical protein